MATESLIPYSNLHCYCRHRKGHHSLGVAKCDHCDCSQFRLDRSRALGENDELIGAMCVTPEAPTPSQTIVSEVADNDRGSAVEKVWGKSGLKDSGKRLSFESGMVRDVDDNKPAFDLIIPENIPYEELMLTRWAELLRKGAIKYSRRNWEKADSLNELDRAKASAFRHFMQWFSGETDEDHAAAVFFNINEVETIRYKLGKDNA
jgi:hypothetical protein